MSTRRVASALVLVVLGLLFAVPAGAQAFDQNPVLFVHGIEGSGGQFESQAMRFMSNGYPADWIDTVDYNSTRAVGDTSEVDQQIDDKIAELKSRTGKSQVDVIAHSLGTTVMNGYLTDATNGAARRANVSHYINVDGQSNNPGVPTLAVWAGRGTPGRSMAGAQNVTIPNQTHVQTCTSRESFVEYYKFLTGGPPAYDEPVRQNGSIEIAGRALNFPENSGALGTTLEIWPVDGSGQRTGASPVFSTLITDNSTGGGDWGPVTVQAGQRYEFALVNATTQTLHIYNEPFVRSDYTIRLLQSLAIENDVGNRPGSAAGVNIRYKELWGNQGSENDQLLIDGLNICTPTLCPISKQVNAFFVYDVNRDGQTDLSRPDPTLNALPFITGADVFMRGSDPPDDTISLQLMSRGTGPVRTLNIPNWDSVGDGFSVYWNDFENTISLDGYARPVSATPATISLVPAFEPCTGADGSHAPPLTAPSCSAPTPTSDYLTVGTPDANGNPARSTGQVRLMVVGEFPISSENGNQADVQISSTISDVRKQSDLSDYTGQLQGVLGLRITDRLNGAGLSVPATATDLNLPFTIGCAATTGAEGGTCNVATTANALSSGNAVEGKRAVWALHQVRVYDGGADGLASTTGDNTLFEVQGLFAP
jgi:lipase/uncharacterized protein/lipase (class 2)